MRRWRSAAPRRSTPAAPSSPPRPTISARWTRRPSSGCGTRPGPRSARRRAARRAAHLGIPDRGRRRRPGPAFMDELVGGRCAPRGWSQSRDGPVLWVATERLAEAALLSDPGAREPAVRELFRGRLGIVGPTTASGARGHARPARDRGGDRARRAGGRGRGAAGQVHPASRRHGHCSSGATAGCWRGSTGTPSTGSAPRSSR